MGFSIPNPISAAKNTFDHLEDAGKSVLGTTANVVKTTAGVAETTADAAQAGFGVTKNLSVEAFKFESSMTKLALNRAFDGVQTVGAKTGSLTRTGFGLVGRGFDSLTHPGSANPPSAQGLKFSETKDASEIAYKRTNSKVGDVYQFADGKQWRVADVQNDPKTGFRAVALKPLDANDKRVIVAYSGSDEGVDWLHNAGQALGLSTGQYKEAVDFANKWKAQAGGSVILTGHSLGGGLASYAAIKTGLHATAVNSAPLALDHLGLDPRAASRITQYYVPGEALSILNEKNPLDVRPGLNIAVRGKDSILDPRSIGSNHSLDHVAPDIALPKYLGNFN